MDEINSSVTKAVSDPMEKIRQWVASTDGQAAIIVNLQRAHILAAQFREAERIDPESLHKPFTL